MAPSDPEVIVYREGNGPASFPFVPPDWFSIWTGNYGWFCSVLKQILASSTSKFGIEIPRVENEDLNSSTESTNSTSLIHCIASAGNCEQEHTSVLNLIFQQAKVAGVGNLSKWRSEICSRCWSVPQFFEESPPLKMTESLADGPDWHLRSRICSGLLFFSDVDIWSGSSMVVPYGFNSWG